MRIAVIGSGNIGGTLGRKLASAGHEVTFGVRRPQESDESVARVSDIAGALAEAEVVLIAIPAAAVAAFLAEHAAALEGRLVIDATNRMGAPVANAAAEITSAAPGARYVRAFNTLGWENFADPVFDGQPADLLFSAPQTDREAVELLIESIGLRPAYLGAGKQDVVDLALPLWFNLVQAHGGNRRLAFRILTK